MSFNYNKLRGRIIEKFGKYSLFAQAMGWTRPTLTNHLAGLVEWRQTDICRALEILELSESDIQTYFFDFTVQGFEPNDDIEELAD